MDKIQFDHSQNTISETIGVCDERDNQIFETVRDICYQQGGDVCKDIEKAIEQLNPESPAEYLLIGFKAGYIYKGLIMP